MKPVTTDDMFDLMESWATSAAFNAALELGLFWLLAERPMDTVEIAQVLEISVSTVKVRIHRARQRFAIALDKSSQTRKE